MGEEGLRYDAMVEQALRSVVRRALSYAAERGLPGDHHFYVSFRTDHPGVDIPAALRERYPNEMTIVLQHQFWGLDVGEDAFGVTLSFADVPERLTIPFAAISAFADPSVRFGLQFESGQTEAGQGETGEGETPAVDPVAESVADPVVAPLVAPLATPEQNQQSAETSTEEGAEKVAALAPANETARANQPAQEPGQDDEPAEQDEADEDAGAKVIMLDPYRKK